MDYRDPDINKWFARPRKHTTIRLNDLSDEEIYKELFMLNHRFEKFKVLDNPVLLV